MTFLAKVRTQITQIYGIIATSILMYVIQEVFIIKFLKGKLGKNMD